MNGRLNKPQWFIQKPKAVSLKKEQLKLWDEWAQSRFNDYLDDLVLSADQLGLPATPLRQELVDIRQSAEKIIHTQTELGCRQSLIHPGNGVQRFFLKLTAICEVLLPLIAMGAVGYQVFYGFYDSTVTDEPFLGTEFAVHGALLIALSWLIPYFILKKMQPSLEKAAMKGLNKGMDTAMARIEMDVKQALDTQQQEHQQITDSLDNFIKSCEGQGKAINSPENELLNRMLVD